MSIFCPHCRQQQPAEHDYCIRCGASLPTHLLGELPAKRVRFFAGTKIASSDLDSGYLRVSCYLRDQRIKTEDGEVLYPGRHVRFSVWDGVEARCVLSLSEAEAIEMADYIHTELLPGRIGTAG